MSLFKKKTGENAVEPIKKPSKAFALKGGSYSLAITAIVLAILIVVNIMVCVIPKAYTNLDISSANLYSITSNTKVVVNNLEKDVNIYWIVQSGEEDSIIENLLAKYESLSSHITVTKKNPDVYPTFASQYTDETVENNSIVVESGSKYRFISYDDIYPSEVDYSTYSYVYSFDGEGCITSAIDYVVRDDLPLMYIITGHGEADLPDAFSDQLDKSNISTQILYLVNENSVPEDADAVLIYAPETDISEEEEQILIDYVCGGGKLLVIAGPTKNGKLTNLYNLLVYYDVESPEGVVVEGDKGYYAFQQPYLLIPDLVSGDITDALIDAQYNIILPISQGLTIGDTYRGTVTSLLDTSYYAFSKAAGYDLTTYDYEDGDTYGPFSLSVDIEDANGEGEMIWIASSLYLDDSYNSYSSGANLDFTMNCLASLIDENEALAIRSKSLGYKYLTINDSAATLLKVVMIGVVPAVFVIGGIITAIERRRMKNEQG